MLPARPLLVTFGSVLRPDGGVQVRSRVLLEALTELGSCPTVVSTCEPPGDDPEGVITARLVTPRRRPRLGFSPELARLIRQAAVDSDLIIIANAMFMPAVALSRSRLPILWDTNECQTVHYGRLPRTPVNLLRLAAWWLLERWAARRCTVAVAIGAHEAVSWRRLRPELRDRLVTVDHVARARPATNLEGRRLIESRLGRAITGPVLLFVGTMRAKHNSAAAHWMVDVLAPQLRPDMTLVLCGRGTEDLGPPTTGAAVATLGFVENVDAMIAGADLCLAPLASGAGVHTKVLHYLAHGRRVLGTAVAFEGLPGAPGVVTSSLAEFADRVESLLGPPETAAQEAERQGLQQAWLDANHGHARIVAQWHAALAVAATSGAASERAQPVVSAQ